MMYNFSTRKSQRVKSSKINSKQVGLRESKANIVKDADSYNDS